MMRKNAAPSTTIFFVSRARQISTFAVLCVTPKILTKVKLTGSEPQTQFYRQNTRSSIRLPQLKSKINILNFIEYVLKSKHRRIANTTRFMSVNVCECVCAMKNKTNCLSAEHTIHVDS